MKAKTDNKINSKSRFKRTSIGSNGVPTNKHKKRMTKRYRGQGRV